MDPASERIAELEKALAEEKKLNAEQKKLNAEQKKLNAEQKKLNAEQEERIAELSAPSQAIVERRSALLGKRSRESQDSEDPSPVTRPAFFTSDAHGGRITDEDLDSIWRDVLSRGPRVADVEQRFLRDIQAANVKQAPDLDLDPGDVVNWPDEAGGDGTISVTRVSWSEQEDHVDAVGSNMRIVKLPNRPPMGAGSLPENDLPLSAKLGDTLFWRNVDTELIQAWSRYGGQAIVLGNPGISKSWLLVKYLVLAANPELFDSLAQTSKTEATAAKEAAAAAKAAAETAEIAAVETAAAEATEGSGAAEGSEAVAVAREAKVIAAEAAAKAEDAAKAAEPPLLPQVIAFAIGGSPGETFVYYLGEGEGRGVVHEFEGFAVLKRLNRMAEAAKSAGLPRPVRVLYEPGASDGPVPFLGLDGTPCLAALSPKRMRYKEPVKQVGAKKLYMPCPTRNELVTIASFLAFTEATRAGKTGDARAASMSEGVGRLLRRLDKIGPFTRQLFVDEEDWRLDATETEVAIELEAAKFIDSPREIELEADDVKTTTYRIVRFVVPNAGDGRLKNYRRGTIVWAHNGVIGALRAAARQQTVEALRSSILAYMERRRGYVNAADSKATYLMYETLVEIFLKHGIKWPTLTRVETSLPERRRCGGEDRNAPPSVFPERLPVFDASAGVKWRMMQPSVLYRPGAPNYPFTDMMWKVVVDNRAELHCAQVTLGATHPATASKYRSMCRRLELPADIEVVVHIFPLPCDVDGYLKNDGKLWEGLTKPLEDQEPGLQNASKWVVFQVVKPHETLCNEVSTATGEANASSD